jgi:hypothetical protein
MMQADDVTRIKDKAVTARARLLVAVDGFDGAAWEWRPEDGRWSARMTLAHVGSAQWSHLEVARCLVAGQPLELPNFDLDAWNAAQVTKRADWSVAQVLADLEAAHLETLAFLDALDAKNLAITGLHPALGEVSVGQVLRIIALHDNLHRRDILRLRRKMGR